ncbi:hypothetical protein SAMN00017405_2375 [Desulfonispora thiosulfatigenes DSM 11270]|uniref:Uncharacterized protein n=1 Tax=Desulfonispora thiosulfatigenes DSM 11270 TaxID=656914 RepID=A0A1W1UU57_DESTI|nr:hypothetical protein [Desulfonispora thiosulfatigenes]SMB84622.1 hypothetical protein SAMN00017405_2375 [Desulfonispora thiosulfatigenes DSM 11270]
MKGFYKCSVCKQNLQLVDEYLADFKSVTDKNNNLLCINCYQNLCDREAYY